MEKSLPDALPEQSAQVPESQYVMIQSKGGSILLGPILGSLNIAANTKKLAEKYKDKYVGVDPFEISYKSILETNELITETPSYKLMPFVFIQECYDDKFRLSLVYHVENGSWTGRYTYHLPTQYTKENFSRPNLSDLERYRNELSIGADQLSKLLKADVDGKLTPSGKKIDFGSLYIVGNKMGGMGIYTMPEELHFPDTDLVEEGDDYVIIRRQGNMKATGLFGGLAFGVHYFKKDQLHTYNPM
ncbi:hypothetical protein ACJJH9_12110 [Microbulbifer sp. DLAB2-AF]|uniref:hypothetical protein n=1 Tax=Microbulbifer sp. DLAB2-AF TaxID=3243395 RepID=UPI004039D8BF